MAKKPLSDRQKAFVAEYLVSLNASDAYRKAGYSPINADANASRLMVNESIRAAIEEAQAARVERLEITADDLLQRLWSIATADATELSNYFTGACRYCWGVDHGYQWKSPREFAEAVAEAAKAKADAPADSGGYGFKRTRIANPDCPECEGLGVPYVQFTDTSKLSPQARLLFEGVKQTQSGLEFKMADKQKALEMVAEHIGFFKKRDERRAGALADAFEQLWSRGSKAPLRRDALDGDS